MNQTLRIEPAQDEGKILLKSCPKCSGDRQVDRDHDGWYIICFACGHTTYPDVYPARMALLGERRQTN